LRELVVHLKFTITRFLRVLLYTKKRGQFSPKQY